jgi:hypothetical protein
MNPVLKKMMFKGQSPVLLLRAPDEFGTTARAFGVPLHNAAKGRYPFVLGFARSLADAGAVAAAAGRALDGGALFWLAYPKGTSKKYRGADINRDTLHQQMRRRGFEGVTLVALDDDWSAMRFKRLE